MFAYRSKQIVFQGRLAASPTPADAVPSEVLTQVAGEQPNRYWALSQTRAELQDPENSPSVSMWGFLLGSERTELLNAISIYAERGSSSEKMRMLYMNDVALSIWKQMDRPLRVSGRLERPPHTAFLTFGMPFGK